LSSIPLVDVSTEKIALRGRGYQHFDHISFLDVLLSTRHFRVDVDNCNAQ